MPTAASMPGDGTLDDAAIRRVVRDFARGCSALGPVAVSYGPGTRRACLAVLASVGPQLTPTSGIDFTAPSYVVVMRGAFQPLRDPIRRPRVDASSPPRVWTTALLVLDALTGRVVGSAMSTDEPDLSSIDLISLDIESPAGADRDAAR